MRGHDQAGSGGDRRDGSGLTSAPEIARFLREHPPFDALDPRDVARVATAAELEEHPAGATIFSQGAEPPAHVRIVRSGSVEILSEGRVLDLVGVGEMFGHASMLSGLPTGFEARAAQPTTCYRAGMELVQEVLAVPEGLRYVARSLLAQPTDLHVLARETNPTHPNVADAPVASLLRSPAVVCAPETSIRAAAQRMSDAGANAIVVDLAPVGLGILTDRDLRTRVVAAGLGADAPVSVVMSAPAYTCSADRTAGDVLLEMLDRGLRHLPVVSAAGELLGMIEDMDLVAARTRSWYYLRRRIAAAASPGDLADVAREVGPMVVSLHEAQVAAANVMAVYAVCVDALTRRMLELTDARPHRVGVDFAWLAMGSQARREALPSSDLDSAIVYFSDDDGVRDRLVAVGRLVLDGLQACGLRLDEHGVNASAPAFVRSVHSWQREARSWLADPTQEKALVLSSAVVDSRPVWGVHTGTPVADTFALAPDHPALLRLMARFALSQRPPTGFLRGLVVEHSGEHRGRLDLKRGGSVPIVALARWAAMSAGVTSASTAARLRVASSAGTLAVADAHTLADAFTLINNVRLEHQVRQLRAEVAPDDYVAPDELSPLRRTQLKETFRAVADIQKRVDGQLRLGAG
ncbi:MAG TPA: putative nucleotidyltransferase substrate binding domain-containing protein [Solirubrobacteraceae bacterium]|nr:putative nucleotidyltransferase substrate binding domain-containing protein [Solirubrobacteraceae bacterium]